MPKCDVGGCCEAATFTFKNWDVCGKHLTAYWNDLFDLDIYFELKERKVNGNEAVELDIDDLFDL